jgi:D-alanyl-D-alanine carboxypeptidase
MWKLFLAFFLAAATLAPASASNRLALPDTLRSILQSYLKERGAAEHVTAASLSVSLRPGDAPLAVAAGTEPSNLFQIGSNTKAFTAVTVLQLEALGKLHIDDRVGRWLPQYPAWKNVTIRRLLNMTSGIPTYDNNPKMQADFAAQPYRNFSEGELVAYVYPRDGKSTFAPGWTYSNTGYILTQMIVERITGRPFAEVLRTKIFGPLGLGDTYYAQHRLAPDVHNRLVAGYFASDDAVNRHLAPLYGKNVRDYTLSWAQAAGGIVATPADVTRWARRLYSGTLLPAEQQAELMTLVSNKNGRPISATNASDPHGFGLGVAQLDKPPLGRIWYYEGETLGYRVLHAWLPTSNSIVTIALNSQPREKEDKIGELMSRVAVALRQR